MRRSVLVTLVVLGSLISLIGTTGLFAALTDTARTGTNSVDSGALAAAADIQLATATAGAPIACGTFSENLETGFFTASDVAEGYQSDTVYFCIKNVGSQPVSISASVDELTDTDTACTGDEALHGDATCGSGQLGELSSVLDVGYAIVDCSNGSITTGGVVNLQGNATTAAPLTPALAAGETACYGTAIAYQTGNTPAEVQQAQSDQVTWRFKFTAQA